MEKRMKKALFISIPAVAALVLAAVIIKTVAAPVSPWDGIKKKRTHFDHSQFYSEKFKRPQDVTLSCLKCHESAAKELMKTAHWKWERPGVSVPGHIGFMSIGKKNLPNNFCLGVKGNEKSCNSCHAGYGWKDDTFDFSNPENVDCLICHDWSGGYSKGAYGLPGPEVDLAAAAKSVGYPKRENCGVCHNYGGGGMGVKHGDLDQSLIRAYEDVDVHMGRHGLLCIDCHRTEKHVIRGTSFSVSVDHRNGIDCIDCHAGMKHADERINAHMDSVSCQACHIPAFSRRAPTKTFWDWSKAGDASRKDDPHRYLKIKGEFVYEENMVPEYYWFNLEVDRYLWNDRMDPDRVTHINPPRGDIYDTKAKIWPYKVHRALQPYDRVYRHLLQPVTAGEGGYWSEFNWDKAFRLSEGLTGIKYSGQYGFAKTDMHWPVSHMVSPREKSLRCGDCHGDAARMDWKALGYPDDPMDSGGRKSFRK
ncbi:MAG: tetrathionate reductase family octaheme c-type cytochrome [Spirochaetes bacterium]|jgi:octaheme c-type cytochrome (tetrathionate reductase family)|nr:tetrathionate reductase family octaheme c-type cytochrome [Spirochaetota bacterium]